MIGLEVQRPEWLKEALPEVIRALRLIEAGRVPKPLVGYFVRTAAMRLLRSVYGSDLDTAAAIREYVLEQTALWQDLDRMTPAQLKAYEKELMNE